MRDDRDQKAATPVERYSKFASPRDRILSLTDELSTYRKPTFISLTLVNDIKSLCNLIEDVSGTSRPAKVSLRRQIQAKWQVLAIGASLSRSRGHRYRSFRLRVAFVNPCECQLASTRITASRESSIIDRGGIYILRKPPRRPWTRGVGNESEAGLRCSWTHEQNESVADREAAERRARGGRCVVCRREGREGLTCLDRDEGAHR